MKAPVGSMVTLPQQLPIWPEDMRGLPNDIARSALFNVAHARRGTRKNLKRRPIAALGGISITYTGEELRQDDEDVFLQILHIARHHEIGTSVRFTAYGLLSELGWGKNGASYKRLVECLDRLKATALTVTVELPNNQRRGFSGSLIRAFRWREEGTELPLSQWEVLLEKEIVALFGPTSYTRLEWRLRLRLNPMAKWLHSFYHTHREPIPYSVAKLHQLTGSEIKELRQFRYKLRQSLDTLVKVGFFTRASIDPRTDFVHVERSLRPALG